MNKTKLSSNFDQSPKPAPTKSGLNGQAAAKAQRADNKTQQTLGTRPNNFGHSKQKRKALRRRTQNA